MIGAASAAPAVHARRKSRRGELEDARAVRRAAYLWQETDAPIMVESRGRLLGVLRGDSRTHVASFVPIARCGADNLYDNYDAALVAASEGKHFTFHWYKYKGAGVFGNWYDMWPCIGNPAAGAYGGTARTAKQFSRTTTGAMCTGPQVSPLLKFMKRSAGFNTESGNRIEANLLYDRVLAYETCSMTAGNQVMDNTLTAQRFVGGAGDPRGLQIMGTADTVHNATAANLTQLRFTDSAGNTLQSVPTTPTLAKIVSIAAPTTTQPARVLIQSASTRSDSPFLPLGDGKLGARLINDYTWSAAPTGTTCFALVYPYALNTDTMQIGHNYDYDYLSGVEALAKYQVFDDACLNVMVWQNSAAIGSVDGNIEFGWQSS